MSVFLLEIITPEKQFFKGEVEAVTCEALDGELCVMRGHQTMIAVLTVGEIRIKAGGEWRNAFNSEGFMEVRPDETVIFTQTCEWPEDIDEARAELARQRALDDLRHAQSVSEHRHSEISLARSMKRLRILSNRNINNK